MPSLAALAVLVGSAPVHGVAGGETGNGASFEFFESAEVLTKMRELQDIGAQRRHVWKIFSYLTHPVDGNDAMPFFESWHGEGELFEKSFRAVGTGIRGFVRTQSGSPKKAAQATGVPVIAYTLYNGPAYDHILRFRLNQAEGLNRLRKSGSPDPLVSQDRSIPTFPEHSVVLKTVWWPVARDKVAALPVWDPATNPPRSGGNPYVTWARTIAIGEATDATDRSGASVSFAGHLSPHPARVSLEAFYRVSVDAEMARRIMRDPESGRAALIALGRPLREGDYLLLVSVNVMTREVADWVWATFWWHDRPDEGPFSVGRPASLRGEWRNYLMDVAFDSDKPLAPDGGPHVAFNPWLEGRFPDGGNGAGIKSNCMACHRRASYPAINFLPVTRGAANIQSDPAYAPGQLRTSFLWSLPIHAKP